MNGKGYGRKVVVVKFKILYQHFSGGIEENHEVPHDRPSLDSDLDLGPPTYKARMLIIWLQYSVHVVWCCVTYAFETVSLNSKTQSLICLSSENYLLIAALCYYNTQPPTSSSSFFVYVCVNTFRSYAYVSPTTGHNIRLRTFLGLSWVFRAAMVSTYTSIWKLRNLGHKSTKSDTV